MKHNIHAIEEAFSRMKKAGWNPNGGVKWGFYFFNRDRAVLSKMRDFLLLDGYVLGYFWETEEGGEYVLHVIKIENHTVKSLHERNRDLNDLARTFHLDSYDGWDVEPIRG